MANRCCCFLLFFILAFQVFSQDVNFQDSISKLKGIATDSVYTRFATKISNLYVTVGRQEEGIAFLQQQMKTLSPGSEKHQHLFLLLSKAFYQKKDYERSLALLDSAFAAKAVFNPDVEAKLWRLKAQNYYRTEAYAKSLESYKASLALLIAQHDSAQMDDVYSAISTCYFSIDNLPQALHYAQEAWKISVQTNDMESRSRILNTMGNINKTLGNRADAKKNFEECFTVAESTGDHEGMILSTSSLALMEMYAKNYDNAMVLIQKGMQYSRELDVPYFMGGLYVNLARIKTEMGRIPEAIEDYKESVRLSEENGDRNYMGLANANIAFLLTDEKKYSESNEYLKKAWQPAEETGDLELLKEIAGGYYDNYKGLNNHQQALKYHELYSTYSDSVMNDSKMRELNNLKTTFAVEEKERELMQRAESERIISGAEIKKQKLIRNFSIVGGLMLMVLAIFIFQRYRERHRTSLLLAEKNQTIEKAYTDLKTMQTTLVETERQREAQNVRVRIARDIHDEIGSGLTKITLLSDVVRKKIPQPEISDSLSKIASYSKGVSASLGEIVWAVNPVHDNVVSLVAYMKNTANHLLEDSGISYKLNFPAVEIQSPVQPEVKRNIYLVMKEALNNALKYSGAKNIVVTLELEQERFRLSVKDDGSGFNPASAASTGVSGNGLLNMQIRMQQHGNRLQINSSPGGGCEIIAEGKLI